MNPPDENAVEEALRREIDVMNKKLKPLGLISTSRTGAVAMTRGAKIFN